MIKVTIRQAAIKRGHKNAYQFGESVGFTRMVASRIWKGEQFPKLKTLETICTAWQCGVDELVTIKPDRKKAQNGQGRQKSNR